MVGRCRSDGPEVCSRERRTPSTARKRFHAWSPTDRVRPESSLVGHAGAAASPRPILTEREIRMVRERCHPHRVPVPWRRLAISVVAAALVTTACAGAQPTTSSAASAATSGSSASADPSPSISPPTLPGGRLVYAQFIGDVGSLFTSDPDGTDIRPLLPAGTGELPRWSPDGRHISIVADNGDGLVFGGLIDPDGSHYVKFDSPDPTLNLGCFAWSPGSSDPWVR